MEQVRCEICDEEFENENQLMQHKAQRHAGQSNQVGETAEGIRPSDDDLEAPDLPRAVNE